MILLQVRSGQHLARAKSKIRIRNPKSFAAAREVFIFSGILAFIIALLTVSFQAIKTAFANPVDALKYE